METRRKSSQKSNRRRRKPKPERVWLGKYQTTVNTHNGAEALRGYGRPRRQWDPLPALERERLAAERASLQSLNLTYPVARNYAPK